MSDADDRFVERLADKLAPLLGPRLRVIAIDLERPTGDRVRIVVTVETSAKPRLMIEEGDSLTDVTSRVLAKRPKSDSARRCARSWMACGSDGASRRDREPAWVTRRQSA